MRIALLGLAVSLVAAPAFAGDSVDVDLTRGGGIRYPFFSYVPFGCTPQGAFKIEVVEAPKHGKLSFRYEDTVKEDGECAGHKFRANVMYFQPDPKYVGEDSYTLKLGTFANTAEMTMHWQKLTLNLHIK